MPELDAEFPRDKRALMQFCGYDPDAPPTKEVRKTWYSTSSTHIVEVTVEEKFDEFWKAYRDRNRVAVVGKEQTVIQLVGECLTRGLGLGKGSVEARRKKAIELYPGMFTAPDPPEPSPITWMHGKKPETTTTGS